MKQKKPLSPVLDPATGVALHYGDPLGEQRRMSDTPTLIDRSHRKVIAVRGPEARVFTNNLLSQKLDDAPDGFGAFALDLDAQGHILHQAGVIVDAGTVYLDVEPQLAASLTDFLTRMVFWSDVTIEETDLAVVTTSGVALDAPSRAYELGAFLLFDALLPRPSLPSAAAAWEGQLAGTMAYDAARVRGVWPEMTVDLDAKSIPHEVPGFISRGGQPGAVHLDKGCYRGQETVARVENLGRSPRLLVMLQLDGSSPELPEPGAPVTAPALRGRTVGRLGTVVHDHEYGPIALALVKRSAIDQEVALDIGGTAAVVDRDSLPTDEGVRAGRAAVENLRRGR